MKKAIASIINKILSPLGGEIVAKRELESYLKELGNPSPSSLRLRLFEQMAQKGFNPKHIIDVGAHKADWSRDARNVFPKSAFTLIEPQIEMKPSIDKFCSEASNIRWIVAGAGAEQGEMSFTIAPNPDASSFIFSKDAEELGYERRMVPVITLDSVCEEFSLPIPEIAKIDAEGTDLDVMKGAQTLIGVTEVFFLEVPLFDYSPTQSFHSIIAFMREQGYEPYDITELNRRPSDDALGLMEMAFAKKTGILRDHHEW